MFLVYSRFSPQFSISRTLLVTDTFLMYPVKKIYKIILLSNDICLYICINIYLYIFRNIYIYDSNNTYLSVQIVSECRKQCNQSPSQTFCCFCLVQMYQFDFHWTFRNIKMLKDLHLHFSKLLGVQETLEIVSGYFIIFLDRK